MKVKNLIILGVVIGISVFFFIFIITSTWIGYGVQQDCNNAQARYEGDCVEALIQFVDNDGNSYRERNSAIWALGQMGDERALPVLEGLYTGDIPEREPLDEGISQYELKKAINLSEGGFNITAFVWRSKI